MTIMEILSPAFDHLSRLPAEHTVDGPGTNPPLEFIAVPSGARSLALLVHDPDVPKDRRPSGIFDHWVVFNLPVTTTAIGLDAAVPGIVGTNTKGTNAWVPAAPPPGSGNHRYYFRLYALDSELDLGTDATRQDVLDAMEGHLITSAEIMGTYSRG